MVNVPKSVYVTLGGGLGDVYYVYMKGENGWGYIKSLKEKYPNTEVKALCSTHNPQTVEFIKYNPYIDSVKDYGWVLDGNEIWNKFNNGSVRLKNQYNLINKLKFQKPAVYLNKNDSNIVNNIINSGKYILMHPFAGEPHRIAMPSKEYVPLIDQLIDQLKYNVVIIGSTYTRTNRFFKEPKAEEFNYERDGVFNLIGKTNSRVSAVLTKHQHHFIGCWSAYSCASWLNGKPTTVIIQNEDKQKLRHKQGKGKRWYKTKCQILTTEGPATDPRGTNFDKLRIRAINSIRK